MKSKTMNFSKKVLVLALSMSFVETALAFRIEDTVVKIQSRNRVLPARQSLQKGSGVLFRHEGLVYALTSEHVIWAANGPRFNHQVSGIATPSHPAWESAGDVIASDYGAGLALIKILPQSDAASALIAALSLPSLADFAEPVSRAGVDSHGVQTAGFPWRASELSWDQRGELLNPRSDRMVLPSVTQMLELLHAHGEFGMSGGGVFSQDGQRVLGVLSHQSVEMLPGTSGQITQAREGLLQNHVFAVPAPWARRWALRMLAGAMPTMSRSVYDPSAVIFDGLEFSARSGQSLAPIGGGTDAIGIGGTDVVGIGGTDVVGIGGTDVIGIGGTNAAVPSVRIQVKLLDAQRGGLPTAADPQARAWTHQLKEMLGSGVSEVFLDRVILRGAASSDWVFQEVRLTSLPDFFTWVTQRQALPLATGAVELGAPVAAAMTQANTHCGLAPAAIAVQLRAAQQIMTSVGQTGLRRTDILAIQSLPALQAAWNVFFRENFDNAVQCTESLDHWASVL